MQPEHWAMLGAVLVAALVFFEQMLDRIPPLAEKAIAAVRSVRAVVEELRRKRE